MNSIFLKVKENWETRACLKSRIFFYRSRQLYIKLYNKKIFFLFFTCSLLNNNLSNCISIFYTCPLLNFDITFCYSLKVRSSFEYIMIENKRGFILADGINAQQPSRRRVSRYDLCKIISKKKSYTAAAAKKLAGCSSQRPPQDFSTRVTSHAKVESFPRDCEWRKFPRWITRR